MRKVVSAEWTCLSLGKHPYSHTWRTLRCWRICEGIIAVCRLCKINASAFRIWHKIRAYTFNHPCLLWLAWATDKTNGTGSRQARSRSLNSVACRLRIPANLESALVPRHWATAVSILKSLAVCMQFCHSYTSCQNCPHVCPKRIWALIWLKCGILRLSCIVGVLSMPQGDRKVVILHPF